jgi:hypothetical protein
MAGDCIDSRDQANQKANAQTTEGRSHALILPHFEILRRENSGPDWGCKFGSYGIFTTNEEEGDSIENQRPGLRVTVTAENPSQNVSIRLQGPRRGVLTGLVTVKVTRRQIGADQIRCR